MGDGGSLVLGLMLAFLTVRTTYYGRGSDGGARLAGGWYGVFMPLVVLAVPDSQVETVARAAVDNSRLQLLLARPE